MIYKVGFDGVALTSYRQRVTPSPMLGRVTGTMRLILSGTSTLGALVAGLLAALVGLRPALWATCLPLLLVWVPVVSSPLRHAGIADQPFPGTGEPPSRESSTAAPGAQ